MNILDLAQQLIRRPSVTPNDADCQVLLSHILVGLGFSVQHWNSGRVKNLWARIGDTEPLFVFAGHTDVVAPGDLSMWISPPFEPDIRENILFGRGACDMKGALAAMVVAVNAFLEKKERIAGSIGFLITSGEEGDDFDDGTPYVMKQLFLKNQLPHYCLIGEPSSEKQLGDTLKVGRRGSLTGCLKILGKQGHVAYPQHAENPIHCASHFLHEFTHISWDVGNDFFPPTSLQMTQISADSGSGNVIPGELNMVFNFRYSPISSQKTLREHVEYMLKKYRLNYQLQWRLSGLPFLTSKGPLLEAAQQAIQDVCQITPILSTSGGTSDGRFIAPYGVDVIELGLINKTIHQINESTSIKDLEQLCLIYEKVLELLL